MKNFTKKLKMCGAVAALFLCGKAQAAQPITRDTYLIYASSVSGITATGILPSTAAGSDTNDFVANPSSFTSVAYFKTDQVNYLAAQAVISSVTYVAQTFTDGQASSTTFKVNTYTALSSATATGTSMKISSDTALAGQCISGGAVGLGQFNVCNPGQWALDPVTSSNTACNIAAAIQAAGVVLSTCAVGSSSGIIYSTAPTYGSIWNTFGINSSSITALSSSTFSGGQNNQSITINGTTLLANAQWYPVTSAAQTATNLATAINNSSTTTGVVASAGANAIVYATATAVGFNYAVATSSQQALTLAPFVSSNSTTGSAVGVMVGGSTASYTINTATITLTPNSNFDATGLAMLYTNGGTNITGLTTGTTYFIVDMTSPNQFQLAATSTGSMVPISIQLASSQTKTTADTFTLTPLAITGAGIAYSWVVSDDPAIGWSPWLTTTYGQAIGAGLVGTFNSTGTITTWDLGHVNHGWVGVQVTPPVTGAISLKVKTIGKGD